MSSSMRETVLLVRHCNACGHEWVRHQGCTSWHGFHTCEACVSEDVQTVKECTESQWRAVASHLYANAPAAPALHAAHGSAPRKLVCRNCRQFLPARSENEALCNVAELCDACQAGRHAPTTCLETAYGTTVRLSFQIKVF